MQTNDEKNPPRIGNYIYFSDKNKHGGSGRGLRCGCKNIDVVFILIVNYGWVLVSFIWLPSHTPRVMDHLGFIYFMKVSRFQRNIVTSLSGEAFFVHCFSLVGGSIERFRGTWNMIHSP